jgi:DNA-directed RNA polymerase specialized sigma24 family protein
LDNEKWEHVRTLVRRMAYKVFGELYDDADDCAAAFTEKFWKDPRLEQWPFSSLTEAWLKMQAAGYVNNYSRYVRGFRKREVDNTDELEIALERMARSPIPGPEQQVALSITAEKVIELMGRLRKVQSTVLFDILVLERDRKEFAAELGVGERLVNANLYAGRKRLKELLKDVGLDEDAIDQLRSELHRG